MTYPIDIESLDPLYRDVFRDPANGTPDNISKAGCLVLAKLGKETWNAWRTKYPVIELNGYGAYLNIADFSEQNFNQIYLNFESFIFGNGACFFGSEFTICTFESAVFGDEIDFTKAVFNSSANFVQSKFGNGSMFNEVTFKCGAYFQSATFGHWTYFRDVQFLQDVSFCVKFPGIKSAFGANTNELGTGIFHAITFDGTVFKSQTDFSGHQFNGGTLLSNVQFFVPPRFYGCKFHQDTTFDGADFPDASGSGEAIRAYRTLKLAFNQQQAIREEQRFFKLEMAEEAVRATGAQRFLYKAYELCSDYGFSVSRPLFLLGLSLLGFAGIYGGLSWVSHCYPNQAACQLSSAWAEFSLLQALPLLGLDKWSDTLRGQLFPSGGWVSIGVTLAVITHKTISITALFLAGLALRNLFKLK